MKIELFITDSPLSSKGTYHAIEIINRIRLFIHVDESSDIKELLSDKEALLYDVKHDDIKLANYFNTNFDKIYDSIEYVFMDFEELSIKEFITKNVNKINKKFVIPTFVNNNEIDKIVSLCNEYSDVMDNTCVLFQGDIDPTTLRRCYDTTIKIKEYADKIKKLGLSPMESVMYVYDDLKEKIYKEEDKDENGRISRDLSEVLFSDKIVCAGYANILSAVLNELNINNRVVNVGFKNEKYDEDGFEIGHSRNVAYIKDPKYDIDGVYYFDATFDSKRSENDKIYKNRYFHFARTKEEMDIIDKADGYYFSEEKAFMDIATIYENAVKAIETMDFIEISRVMSTINFMCDIVGKGRLLDTKDLISIKNFDIKKFKETFKEVVDMFDKSITTESLVLLLNNVRKLRYLKEQANYSLDDLYTAYKVSSWNHVDKDTKNYYMIKILVGDKYDVDAIVFKEILRKNDLPKEVLNTQLTKCLKLYKDKKSCNLH